MFGIELPIVIGYILSVVSLGIIYYFYYYKRNEVLPDLRGIDKQWQVIELASLIWLVLLPLLVVCDLLGIHASTPVWASMDAIYFISVGGKVGMKYLESKNSNSQETKTKKDDGTEV